ncbi:Protein isoform 1, partial [Diplonema papillatum]
EIKKTLATEIHLMEMENSLLSQTNQEQLASTAECESDVNTETARRDDDDVSQQLKERILYETEQLKLQSQAIRKDKKNTTKNWRNYADALRLENVELRQRYAVISEAAKKKSEKADEEADIPVKKTKHQAEAEAEAEEEVHDAKTAGDALPSKGTRKQLACVDSDYECPSWAASGECKDNPAFMKKKCRKSCNLCAVQPPPRKGSRRGRSASRAGASESQAEDA